MSGKALWLQLPKYRRLRDSADALKSKSSGKSASFIRSKSSVKPRQKRIPSMSKKRRKELETYLVLRLTFLAEHPNCQRCGKPSECVHHWAGRRDNFLKVETWRGSCVPCNDFAKENPAEAIAENWRAPVGVYRT